MVVEAADYTNSKNVPNACELFAQDAVQASGFYRSRTDLAELLAVIDGAPVTDAEKDRAQQAIAYVWKNQIDDPSMAYALAMGVCLSPKRHLAPDDDDLMSYRRNREYL